MTPPDFSIDSRLVQTDLAICNELMEGLEMGRSLSEMRDEVGLSKAEFRKFVFRACNRYSALLAQPAFRGEI